MAFFVGAADARVNDTTHYSTTETGTTGLNLIPSARFDETGTIRAGIGTSDPYTHSFLGLQIADPLYISLRQTAEISNITQSADRLYPGIDFKLRLATENAYRPAIALGLESAFGHKRMGSEYISFSKRYNSFDFTAGIAWGRLGSAGHIKNPMRAISSHFDKRRHFNSEQPQDFSDWFTGPDIGFFGGIEYFTPLNGLSVKADYGANDYSGERRSIDGFNAPQPWSVGINYSPWDFTDLSAALIGGEKVMARLSLQSPISKWIGKPDSTTQEQHLSFPRTTTHIQNKKNQYTAPASNELHLTPHQPTARQIGHKARITANNSPPKQERISLQLQHMGLKGPSVQLIRHDLEQAIIHKTKTAEEIWQNTTIDHTPPDNIPEPFSKEWAKNILPQVTTLKRPFRFILDNKISLSEEDTGPTFRSAAMIETMKIWPLGLMTGARARINIGDNLTSLPTIRNSEIDTIRSDEENFANNRFGIDQLYGSWLYTVMPDTHIAVSAGYLEEMFAGYGGEILYRPFGKTFAIGAQAWQVNKREPDSTLAKGLASDKKNTAHLNLYYEVPNQNMTLHGKVGRYLAEDFGATIALDKTFENGSKISGFVTATDEADEDIFGDTTHIYSGISFSLPLGNAPYIPAGSEIRVTSAPLARDTGQMIEVPLPLYEATEPFAYRQISRSWPEILN